jgi:hypothetical protein
MLTAWILGLSFLTFILTIIIYVLTINVSQPQITRHGREETVRFSADDLAAKSGNYLISKGCQVIFSPRAFVDYPFGIRVVFAKPDTSNPTIWKEAERTETERSNVHRILQAGEYCGWPHSAVQDPEMTVIGRSIEFESEQAEPGIRVEVQFPGESFQEIKSAEEKVLKRYGETVFSLWLHPLEPKTTSLPVVISLAEEAARCRELAMITLTVPVTFFPITLR